MAGLQILSFFLLITTIYLQDAGADHHHLTSKEDYNNVMSYEVVGTGAHSSSNSDDNEHKRETGIYVFRRQRRSPHIGTHFYRPVYVQPVGVQPVQGYYQGHPNYYHQPQQVSNSHAQAISASFGGNQLLGTGGSGISAAAASAGSGTSNQLVHHGYRRK